MYVVDRPRLSHAANWGNTKTPPKTPYTTMRVDSSRSATRRQERAGGHSEPSGDPVRSNTCGQCGASLEASDRFCGECGTLVVSEPRGREGLDRTVERSRRPVLFPEESTPKPATVGGRPFGSEERLSGLAVASVVCASFLFSVIGSVLGVLLGYRARRDIRSAHGHLRGSGLAVTGIILGWVGVALSIVAWATILIVVLGRGTSENRDVAAPSQRSTSSTRFTTSTTRTSTTVSKAPTYAISGVGDDDVLWIRAGAGVQHQAIGHLTPYETGITVAGDPAVVGESTWLSISTADGRSGWVNSSFLTERSGAAAGSDPCHGSEMPSAEATAKCFVRAWRIGDRATMATLATSEALDWVGEDTAPSDLVFGSCDDGTCHWSTKTRNYSAGAVPGSSRGYVVDFFSSSTIY